ncbi:SSNA1 protein, partial [Casuarius casuarius]|nr:SSNA1 protein [Casuarius casuarius]
AAAAGMAELRARRDELARLIQGEEAERSRLQGEIWALTEKLARTNESLARKMATRNDFDRTIAETEAAYGKILESSQTLLSVLKGEMGNTSKATEPKSTSKEKQADGQQHS